MIEYTTAGAEWLAVMRLPIPETGVPEIPLRFAHVGGYNERWVIIPEVEPEAFEPMAESMYTEQMFAMVHEMTAWGEWCIFGAMVESYRAWVAQ